MSPEFIFYSLITIIILNFLKDYYLSFLNSKNFNNKIPDEVSDVYDKEKYLKSQQYKKTQYSFSKLSRIYGLIIILLFFFLDGFYFLDELCKNLFDSPVLVSLCFLALIYVGNEVLSLPLSFYYTFVIEERFGFNKTTLKLFVLDKIKSCILTILLGGIVLSFLLYQYESLGNNFWITAWIFLTLVSILLNAFYSQLIVPIFNKQTKLEDGELRSKIESYSNKVGFDLSNIFVIDGSRRSTKANAYFSGFGKQKRVTLYDTLVRKLNTNQIIAVIAHEIGHYKKNHIVYNIFFSTLQSGLMLYLLSFLLEMPVFAEALGLNTSSFHIGIICFSILFSPISELISLTFNYFSRKFEYEADEYAKKTFDGKYLIEALKILSKDSLSNLTPHPKYVWWYYSHPTLFQRISRL